MNHKGITVYASQRHQVAFERVLAQSNTQDAAGQKSLKHLFKHHHVGFSVNGAVFQ
jgi:hypothetical protein